MIRPICFITELSVSTSLTHRSKVCTAIWSAVVVTPTTQIQYCVYTSEVHVDGSTFLNNTGYGYYEKVDALTQANGGTTRVSWRVRDSTLRQLSHSGVYVDVRTADSARCCVVGSRPRTASSIDKMIPCSTSAGLAPG